MRFLRIVGWGAAVGLTATLLTGGAALWYLNDIGVGPVALARRIAPGAGGSPHFFRMRKWTQSFLLGIDPGNLAPIDPARLAIGANREAATSAAAGRLVQVASEAALRQAISHAEPGDLITVAPGDYRLGGPGIEVVRAGAENAPITVRAARRGSVTLDITAREGFTVYAPYWRFENLVLRGACRNDSECDHAFHILGKAHHFGAFNNEITDFNAHFKINGDKGRFPDYGNLEANTLSNRAPRHTANSVTPIDLVGASHWTIRRNLIADFIKQGGDGISYGAFAKGGGSHNALEQNIVWCERLLRGQPGQRVGISLGGGGTAPAYCRDSRCITEQDDSVIASNLVASCSDDGVYINSAARSRVTHNTLVATAGIDLRFAGTSADVEGNLVDGALRSRNGAIGRTVDNRISPIAWRYLGYRPNGGWFENRDGHSLGWNGAAPRRERGRAAPADLCGLPRPAAPAYGAFEDFSACRAAISAR